MCIAGGHRHPLPPMARHKCMRPQAHDIEAVIRQALQKYEKGREELGQLDLSTDSRNFIDEAIEELIDCTNYCVFQIIRLRSIRNVR